MLGALSFGLGLLGMINQNRQANAARRLAEQQQAQANAERQQYLNQQKQLYQQNNASGAYNPADIKNHINDVFSEALKRNLGAANVGLTNAGARSGDSRLNITNRSISEQNALGLTGSIQNAENSARESQFRDLSYTNPQQYANGLDGSSIQNYNHYMQGGADPSSLIQYASTPGMWDFLKNRGSDQGLSQGPTQGPNIPGISGLGNFKWS